MKFKNKIMGYTNPIKNKDFFKLNNYRIAGKLDLIFKILGYRVSFIYTDQHHQLWNKCTSVEGEDVNIYYINNGRIYKASNINVCFKKVDVGENKKNLAINYYDFFKRPEIYKGRFFTFCVILSLKIQIWYKKYVAAKKS